MGDGANGLGGSGREALRLHRASSSTVKQSYAPDELVNIGDSRGASGRKSPGSAATAGAPFSERRLAYERGFLCNQTLSRHPSLSLLPSRPGPPLSHALIRPMPSCCLLPPTPCRPSATPAAPCACCCARCLLASSWAWPSFISSLPPLRSYTPSARALPGPTPTLAAAWWALQWWP